MADYDVFNYGFPPQRAYSRIAVLARPGVPCLVSGPREGFENIARLFASYQIDKEKDRGQVSDMTILQALPFSHASLNLVDNPYVLNTKGEIWEKESWKRGTLLHYSHAWLKSVAKERGVRMWGLDRVEEIEKLEREVLFFAD